MKGGKSAWVTRNKESELAGRGREEDKGMKEEG